MRYFVLSLVMIGLFGKPAQSDLTEHNRDIRMIALSIVEIATEKKINALLAAKSSNKNAFSIYNQLIAKTNEMWYAGSRLKNGYPYCGLMEPYNVNGSAYYKSQDCISARTLEDFRVKKYNTVVDWLRDLSQKVCSQTTNISQNLWELIATQFKLNPRDVKFEIVEKQSISDRYLGGGPAMTSLECHLKIYLENGVCNVLVPVVNANDTGDPIFHKSASSTCSSTGVLSREEYLKVLADQKRIKQLADEIRRKEDEKRSKYLNLR